ncbi:ferrochelatase [Haladaptatus paucihalophilus DX253]|uniref:Ferrochelatase n=1 Tax=Haladaptatus paucihalophilus DX253 TaxID=797209 RepID=E7QPI3_HALPU|nr:ferrochelatase [Haladaptatus paucihalophilus]EFW93466.1 ferrochelatase [Haladaptatus paucihalophilus DX253]SHL19958.1 ferrochelatase [Haladaptatus paucihalophilus DX253]
MTTGVVVLNFGEPDEPTRESVLDYLERIFMNNADLEGDTTEAEARQRSRQLAERRAPGLIEEYEEIGGSPLDPQAKAQADALEAELDARGFDAMTYTGFQFTEPFIADAVEEAHEDGVDELIGLPVYPLCGASTTVASLEELTDAVDERDWDVPVHEITGWHKHPTYNRIRAENIRAFADEEGLGLTDDDTELLFSAHGTPSHYLDEGSRYDVYVEEFCDVMASELDVESYSLGFQNHGNRKIPWTEPEVEDVIADIDAERVVVEPISFMHEQSETLSELDDELREETEEVGLDFYRVPVPHDDERFAGVLADLVEPFVADFDPSYYQFRQCQCKDTPGTMCLNAPFSR